MNAGLDFALAQVKDRDLVIESLQEQLKAYERVQDALSYAEREMREAAEAQLALEEEQHKAEATRLRGKLAEVEKELKNERIERAKSIVSMDRARELAEGQVPIARKEAEWTREATWSDAAIAFDKIARLLGGDDEPK